MEAIKVLAKILTNILTALYEPFGFSLLLSFFAMFFYLYAYEPSAAGKGWKSAIVTWYQKFKESVFFRKLFLLAFVTSMILFRTLLNRNLWLNPLSDVMGGWGIWETVNGEQKLTTECIENVIMMIPFSAVVMWTFGERLETAGSHKRNICEPASVSCSLCRSILPCRQVRRVTNIYVLSFCVSSSLSVVIIRPISSMESELPVFLNSLTIIARPLFLRVKVWL